MREFAVIKNMDEVNKGRVDMTFLPYRKFKTAEGLAVTIEIASCGHSGSMMLFTTLDGDGDVVNASFQFVPGMFPMVDKQSGLAYLYDETTYDAKGMYKLLEEGSIEYPEVPEASEEEEKESDVDLKQEFEASDQNVRTMFDGTGVDLDDDDEDDDEPTGVHTPDELEEEDDEDDDNENIIRPNRLDSINIEDEVKEGANDLPYEDLNELDGDGAEEERSRSMDEIRELVERKKNNKRQNTSYIGVKDSALPTEDGPMQPQNFDQRMAEAASRSSVSELLDDVRRVEEQRKKDIAESQEMKAHYENNRKSKYERKQNFKQNNKQNNHRNNNNRREERKDKLDMNSLDDIIGTMFK